MPQKKKITCKKTMILIPDGLLSSKQRRPEDNGMTLFQVLREGKRDGGEATQ